MQVQMAGASAVSVCDFHCRHCGLDAKVEVRGVGEGVATQLNAPGTAHARAQEAAVIDAERTAKLARCPKCALRSGVAGWWVVQLAPGALTFLFISALLWAPYALGMDIRPEGSPLWMGLGGSLCTFVIAAFFTALSVGPKWSSIDDRIRFL